MGPRTGSPEPALPDEPPPAYAEASGPQLEAGPQYPFGFDDDPAQSGVYQAPPVPPPRPGPSVPPRPQSHEPTTVPTPGRILLHDGKILAYPAGYECPKCHNVGYKNNDPHNPCKKCWEKYGRSWNVVRLAPDAQHLSQRPLPGASPADLTNGSHPPPVPPHHPYQDARLQQPYQQAYPPPNSFAPSNYHGPIVSGSYGAGYVPGYGSPAPGPVAGPYIPSYGPPPASTGAGPGGRPLVVPPGDPRIGGRLCPNCGGAGRTSGRASFGGFVDYVLGGPADEVCTFCRGVGRIF